MGYWSVVVPEATTNLLSDPSFELADPDTVWTFGTDGGVDFTRYTTLQWIGVSCAQLSTATGSWWTTYQAVTVTAQSYTLSARVRRAAGGAPTASHCRAQFDSGTADWDSITLERDGWYLCVKTATATAGSREFGVYCAEAGLLVDAVQLEAKAYRTTYCDGTQAGCSWTGAAHLSASSRVAGSRAGGREVSLDTYGTYVTLWSGGGMPPLQNNVQPQALLPGDRWQSTKVRSRVLLLTIWAKGTSLENLHAVRQALINVIKPDLVATQQPFLLRYSGAAVKKEIAVRYEAGLEGGALMGVTETLGLRLLAVDPFWREIGDSAAVPATTASLSIYSFLAKQGTAWQNFGPPSGTTVVVYAFAVGPDKKLYVGGDFDNCNGVANADNIACYDPATATWSALGTGANDVVRALAVDAAGDIWASGQFTAAGGVANTAYIAKWDVSAGAWVSVVGVAGDADNHVYALCLARDGKVYAGGAFHNIGGVAVNHVSYYDGTWHAMGATGVDDNVLALAQMLDDKIIIGGSFHNAAGAAMAHITSWNGSAYAALGTGLDDNCYCLAANPVINRLWAGGVFTTAGGVTVNCVARWDGSSSVWAALGAGVAGGPRGVWAIAYHAGEGTWYIGGMFTSAGGDTFARGIAKWDGSAWSHIDATFVTPTYVYGLCVDGDGTLYVGLYDQYSVTVPGSTTVTNGGTASAQPVITVSRAGGTLATLAWIRNETTVKTLALDYDLLDGETLTIDLAAHTVTSSVFGNRLDALLPGSEFASWELLPGANVISMWVEEAGSPTVTATMEWRDKFWSWD